MIKKYNVILADPPWEFHVWNKDTGSERSPSAHYNVMSIEGLLTLKKDGIKISEYADDNCVLFLWVTWPILFEYIPLLLNAWEFEYKTLAFEWWKLNKRWADKLPPFVSANIQDLYRLFFLGMGYYTRANPEPCLLCTRGNMPVSVRNERNYIIAPIREHSRKPDEQYTKIESLYPNANYLELFARNTRMGWDSFGNEVNKFDDY